MRRQRINIVSDKDTVNHVDGRQEDWKAMYVRVQPSDAIDHEAGATSLSTLDFMGLMDSVFPDDAGTSPSSSSR